MWDKKTDTIVNNESSEIIRMFNSGFNKLTNNDLDLYPIKLKNKIDLINKRIYENINNGVYKVGFAKTQSNYDFFVKELLKRHKIRLIINFLKIKGRNLIQIPRK